jgi:hypothetical protein
VDFSKFKGFFSKLNDLGIPVPLIRDPKTGKASVSLTLVFISSFYVQVAILNKFAQLFKGVDTETSVQFFLICSGLYFGRTLTKDGKKVESSEQKS